jgi:polar amino acid transport system substrate-binding protein
VRRYVPGVATLLALGILGACTAPTRTATSAPPAAAVAQATPSPSAATCTNPTASLRPPAAMPAPGQMPAGSYMRTIQDRGRLIAGVSSDTLLFGFLNPLDGNIEGFDIDVLHQIAQAIFGDPTKIEYRAITTADRIPKILDGSVDIVGRTFTINCARRAQVDFSSVYFDAGQRVLVRKDSTAKGIQDLGGKKVCATTGSTSIDHITQAASKPIPYPLADFTDCLVAFQNGEVDAISTDDAILAGLKKQDPYATIIGDRFSDEPYGLGIALNHPEFTRFVNGVLDQMRANGTWAALYNTWLVPSLTKTVPAPPPAAYKD